MKANYYRFLFKNTNDGIMNTGSIVNTKMDERFQFCYLSGASAENTDNGNGIDESGEEVNGLPEVLDMLVIADFEPRYLEKALKLLKNTKAERVLLPKCDEDVRTKLINGLSDEENCGQALELIKEPEAVLKREGAVKIYELGEGETFRAEFSGFKVKVSCYGKGENASLVMYYGPADKETKDSESMFTVKSFTNDMKCSMCVDGENHHCAMKCCLYNDYDICRRHSEKDCEQYILGTLLLGNVKLEECGQEILRDFNEEIGGLRVMSVPGGGAKENWDKMFFEKTMEIFNKSNPETAHFKQYFVVPSCKKTSAQTLMDISASDPYHQLVMTSKAYGICASGYLKSRMD